MKELIKTFCTEYLNKTGLIYTPSWGRDSKILKTLVETYNKDTVEDVIIGYFKSNENIYSIPFLKVKFNEILQELVKNQGNYRVMQNPDEGRFV